MYIVLMLDFNTNSTETLGCHKRNHAFIKKYCIISAPFHRKRVYAYHAAIIQYNIVPLNLVSCHQILDKKYKKERGSESD